MAGLVESVGLGNQLREPDQGVVVRGHSGQTAKTLPQSPNGTQRKMPASSGLASRNTRSSETKTSSKITNPSVCDVCSKWESRAFIRVPGCVGGVDDLHAGVHRDPHAGNGVVLAQPDGLGGNGHLLVTHRRGGDVQIWRRG